MRPAGWEPQRNSLKSAALTLGFILGWRSRRRVRSSWEDGEVSANPPSGPWSEVWRGCGALQVRTRRAPRLRIWRFDRSSQRSSLIPPGYRDTPASRPRRDHRTWWGHLGESRRASLSWWSGSPASLPRNCRMDRPGRQGRPASVRSKPAHADASRGRRHQSRGGRF